MKAEKPDKRTQLIWLGISIAWAGTYYVAVSPDIARAILQGAYFFALTHVWYYLGQYAIKWWRRGRTRKGGEVFEAAKKELGRRAGKTAPDDKVMGLLESIETMADLSGGKFSKEAASAMHDMVMANIAVIRSLTELAQEATRHDKTIFGDSSTKIDAEMAARMFAVGMLSLERACQQDEHYRQELLAYADVVRAGAEAHVVLPKMGEEERAVFMACHAGLVTFLRDKGKSTRQLHDALVATADKPYQGLRKLAEVSWLGEMNLKGLSPTKDKYRSKSRQVAWEKPAPKTEETHHEK